MFKTNPTSRNCNLHNAKDGVGGGQSAIYLAAEDVLLLWSEMAYSIFIYASWVCILWVLQFSQVELETVNYS